jgi:phage terminase large subunit-like protein
MSDRQCEAILNTWSAFARISPRDLQSLVIGSRAKDFSTTCLPSIAPHLAPTWFNGLSPKQQPPDGDWRTWLFLGGRGAGKTRAGAEWLHTRAVKGARLALVGATLNDVREVMIEGPSGLRTIAPRADRPRYVSSRRLLLWPSGARAQVFSAEEPERLRGPQFDAAWCDEFCAWPHGEETLALLRMGLRRGSDPRLVVTTTPRPAAMIRRLMAEPGVALTRATTADNASNLAPGFLETLNAVYGGTRQAAQELEGLVLDGPEGALWKAEDFAKLRILRPERWDRLVVAVDPPAGTSGDACGIVAAARIGERAVVLEDASIRGLTPYGWARRVADLARRWKADQIVAEANQGGEMVRAVLDQADCPCPIRMVHARLGKRARAEPVAALYERGRVDHAGAFPALEEELMGLGSDELKTSPDRADALVWALTALLLEDVKLPRVRGL